MHVCRRFSCVGLFETSLTVAHQAPLSLGFPKQENESGLLLPSPVELPYSGVEHKSALGDGPFTTMTTWEALINRII